MREKGQSTSFDHGVAPVSAPQILSPTKQHLLKKRAVLLEKKYQKAQKISEVHSEAETTKQGLSRRSQPL